VQRVGRIDFGDCGPLHRDVPGELRLDRELFVVRLDNEPAKAVAIARDNLVGERMRLKKAKSDQHYQQKPAHCRFLLTKWCSR